MRSRDPRNTWRAGLGDGSGGLRVEGGSVRASLLPRGEARCPSRDRQVDAVGARGRLLVLSGEVSAGVLGCLVTLGVFAGWEGTAMLERASFAVEKSAEAVLPAGLQVAGKGRTRSRGAGRSCSWDGR